MSWSVGDTIHVDSRTTGQPPRTGRVIETIESADAEHAVHYRVRWDDGHESIYYPGADSHVVASPAPPS